MLKNRRFQYWICQFLGWFFVALSPFIYALNLSPARIDYNLVGRLLVLMMCGIFSTHILRGFFKKFNVFTKPFKNVILYILLSVPLTALFCSYLFLAIVDLFELRSESQVNLSPPIRLMASTLTFALFIFSWALIYYTFHYVVNSRKKELNALILESQIKDLEIKSIHARLNPLFLSNSLNSISGLIQTDPGRARIAITELSNILRFSIQSSKSILVPLETEITMLNEYVRLENIRLKNALHVNYEIQDRDHDKDVPSLFLIKIVEYIVYYASSDREQLNVNISTSNHHENLIIKISSDLNITTPGNEAPLEELRSYIKFLIEHNSEVSIYELPDSGLQLRFEFPRYPSPTGTR